MNPRRPIQGIGTVEKLMPNGLFEVEMPNGYRVRAHLDRSLRAENAKLAAGDRVRLEFSAYDMKQARILGCAVESGDI